METRADVVHIMDMAYNKQESGLREDRPGGFNNSGIDRPSNCLRHPYLD